MLFRAFVVLAAALSVTASPLIRGRSSSSTDVESSTSVDSSTDIAGTGSLLGLGDVVNGLVGDVDGLLGGLLGGGSTPSTGSTGSGTSSSSGTPSGSSGSTCSTGPVQCCNSVQPASSVTSSKLLGLIPIDLQGLDIPIGLTCDPINLLGIGGDSCSAQTVCCENNNFSGLIAIGCTPINVGL